MACNDEDARPGDVREWILRNTRILTSIDLQPDMFQPGVSIQTGALILQEPIDVETTANKTNDCPVFVAIANNVGHDKRGTKPRFRMEKGMKSSRKSNKLVKEWRHRIHVYGRQPPRKKVAVGLLICRYTLPG